MSAEPGWDRVDRIARRYEGRWLQGYVRGKLRRDPVYAVGLDLLKSSPLPLLDVGCGIGLFPCWLREHGLQMPIHGIDLDAEKIARARRATASYSGVSLEVGEAGAPVRHAGNVVIFDVLHLLAPAVQRGLLVEIAEALPPGACCIIRATVRDGSWRFWVTRVEDWWLRASRWMNSDAVHYPSAEEICAPFRDRGHTCEVRPLWEGTPFNSYLFVMRAVCSPAGSDLGASAECGTT